MDTSLTISALQHFAYCQRQFALIHLEQAWSDRSGLSLIHAHIPVGDASQPLLRLAQRLGERV